MVAISNFHTASPEREHMVEKNHDTAQYQVLQNDEWIAWVQLGHCEPRKFMLAQGHMKSRFSSRNLVNPDNTQVDPSVLQEVNNGKPSKPRQANVPSAQRPYSSTANCPTGADMTLGETLGGSWYMTGEEQVVRKPPAHGTSMAAKWQLEIATGAQPNKATH